jgi:hypothetical protein
MSQKTVTFAILCFLAACARSPSMPVPDLSALLIDPQSFTRITLRDDVEIATATVRAGAAQPGARWVVVQYVEQENRKGFAPPRESEYANLYLVGEVAGAREEGGTPRERYLVVELWHYYPARGIKTCHQWIIWEDEEQSRPTRASFRFLIEDFGNVFLGEREVRLDAPTLERLGDFYVQVKRALMRRAKDLRLQRPA